MSLRRLLLFPLYPSSLQPILPSFFFSFFFSRFRLFLPTFSQDLIYLLDPFLSRIPGDTNPGGQLRPRHQPLSQPIDRPQTQIRSSATGDSACPRIRRPRGCLRRMGHPLNPIPKLTVPTPDEPLVPDGRVGRRKTTSPNPRRKKKPLKRSRRVLRVGLGKNPPRRPPRARSPSWSHWGTKHPQLHPHPLQLQLHFQSPRQLPRPYPTIRLHRLHRLLPTLLPRTPALILPVPRVILSRTRHSHNRNLHPPKPPIAPVARISTLYDRHSITLPPRLRRPIARRVASPRRSTTVPVRRRPYPASSIRQLRDPSHYTPLFNALLPVMSPRSPPRLRLPWPLPRRTRP